MSSTLARESALGPDWTGHGVEMPRLATGEVADGSPFKQISMVDFAEVAVLYRGECEFSLRCDGGDGLGRLTGGLRIMRGGMSPVL